MSSIYFTPIAVGGNNHPDSVNNPLGQLDAEIHTTKRDVRSHNSQRIVADQALDARIDNLIAAEIGVDEVVDARVALPNDVTNAPATLSDALQRINGLVRHVASYGAVGDGVTDDSAAINAAIADAAGGGTVLFDNLSYYIESRIEAESTSNLTIQGAGPGTEIIMHLEDGYALRLTDCVDCVIRDLKITFTDDTWGDSGGDGHTAHGIGLLECSRCHIDHVQVIGHRSEVYDEGSEGRRYSIYDAMILDGSQDCSITRCHVEYARIAYVLGQGAAGYLTVRNNVINNTSNHCARFSQIRDPNGESIDTTTPDDDYALITDRGCHHNTVAHNRAFNLTQGFCKIDYKSFHNTLAYNHIIGGCDEIVTNGIIDLNSGYCSAIGNRFYVPDYIGNAVIYATVHSWNCEIHDNVIIATPCVIANIMLALGSQRVSIKNNTIRGDGASVGIDIANSCSDISVTGNKISYVTIGIDSETNSSNISDNQIALCTNYGIRHSAGIINSIVNNRIRRTVNNSIRIVNAAKQLTISNNNCSRTNDDGSSADDDSKAHIWVQSNCPGGSINANVCVGIQATAGANSIDCNGASNWAVTNNTVEFAIVNAGTGAANDNNVTQA